MFSEPYLYFLSFWFFVFQSFWLSALVFFYWWSEFILIYFSRLEFARKPWVLFCRIFVFLCFCLNVFLSLLLSVSVRLSSSLVYEICPSSRNSKFILWSREIRHLSDLPTCWCVLASSLFFPWTSKTRWEFSLVNKISIWK